MERVRLDSVRAVRPPAPESQQRSMDECSHCTVTCPACAGPVLEPSPCTGISGTRQVGSGHPVWTRYPGPQPLGAAGPKDCENVQNERCFLEVWGRYPWFVQTISLFGLTFRPHSKLIVSYTSSITLILTMSNLRLYRLYSHFASSQMFLNTLPLLMHNVFPLQAI